MANSSREAEDGFCSLYFYFMRRINSRAGNSIADPVIISHMHGRLMAIKGLLITNIDSPFANAWTKMSSKKLVNRLKQ